MCKMDILKHYGMLVEEVDEADGVARARLELLPVLAEHDAEGNVVHAG